MNKTIYQFEVMKGFILSNLFAFIGITQFPKPDNHLGNPGWIVNLLAAHKSDQVK